MLMKQKQIIKAAPWLKKLLNSYADGINFTYKHPEVKPALLTHFGFLCFGQTEALEL
jgi:acyl-homoserine lactone acylase PvdQ